jgi:protein SCO1
MADGDLDEDVGEVGFGIDAVQFRGLPDRTTRGGALAAEAAPGLVIMTQAVMPKSISHCRISQKAGGVVSLGRRVDRRRVGSLIGALLGSFLLGGFDSVAGWRASIDVSGNALPLVFRMTRASDSREVTAADYRGRVVLLYFGYTKCPDLCPITLTNIADVLEMLGADAAHVRVLFVTVDPDRDKLSVLRQYVKHFAPQIDGLRGTPDQLAELAGRYHAAYSVTPATKEHPYEVTHSAVIYVFDGSGAARLLIPSLASATPDIAGTTADMRRVIDGK